MKDLLCRLLVLSIFQVWLKGSSKYFLIGQISAWSNRLTDPLNRSISSTVDSNAFVHIFVYKWMCSGIWYFFSSSTVNNVSTYFKLCRWNSLRWFSLDSSASLILSTFLRSVTKNEIYTWKWGKLAADNFRRDFEFWTK